MLATFCMKNIMLIEFDLLLLPINENPTKTIQVIETIDFIMKQNK